MPRTATRRTVAAIDQAYASRQRLKAKANEQREGQDGSRETSGEDPDLAAIRRKGLAITPADL